MRTVGHWIIALVIGCWANGAAAQALPFDQSFLTDPARLQARHSGAFTDYVYAVPDYQSRLGKFPNGFFVDAPEVLVSPDSDYKGGKPEDLAQVAKMMQDSLTQKLASAGYRIASQPGPGVLVFRMGLTDLKMKKKKRGVLAYTPIGAVVKAGTDAVKEMMDKVDLTGFALQAELLDGVSNEVVVALVIPGDPSGDRMEFDELSALVAEYGARTTCRVDNAGRPAGQQVDCIDPKARAASTPLPAP